MSHTTIILVLATATSAEGNLMLSQKPPALPFLGKQIADGNGRRLANGTQSRRLLVGPKCQEVCPEAKNWHTAYNDLIDELQKSGSDSFDPFGASKVAELACSHQASFDCVIESATCVDEMGVMIVQGFASHKCLCGCPILREIGCLTCGAGGGDSNWPTSRECSGFKCIEGAATHCKSMMDMDMDIAGDSSYYKEGMDKCNNSQANNAPQADDEPQTDDEPQITSKQVPQAAPHVLLVLTMVFYNLVMVSGLGMVARE